MSSAVVELPMAVFWRRGYRDGYDGASRAATDSPFYVHGYEYGRRDAAQGLTDLFDDWRRNAREAARLGD